MSLRRNALGQIVSVACLCSILVGNGRADNPTNSKRPSEREAASRSDAQLLQSWDKSRPLPPLADDTTFLRRVSLDLTGKLPTPDEVRQFVSDTDAKKRAKLVERLLKSDEYAVNWGRYWRDVLTYYTPASHNYLRWELFDAWLTDQVRKNRPWGEIVTALVTATGINDECAPVNFLTSQFGNPVEIAATTSRVFLGQQLQCAQCHDAKTEPWKREQFHELVAFFGRAKLVQHKDVTGRGTPYAIEGRAMGQYAMTDKKDPKHLIDMQPIFLTGEKVPLAASDYDRRFALARMLTSPKNPWFAKTYVNRMWTALMGWGFYPSVNDLGEGQTPQHPEVLERLAADWTATGYDMRWLFRTIVLTEAYQRAMQPPAASSDAPPPSVCPVRLRAEQIFEAMVRALGFNENDRKIPAPAPSSAPAVARNTGLRHMVDMAFRVDPSLPAEEIHGTIPQALLMMNSVLVNSYTAAIGKTYLAEALQAGKPDDEIVSGLYERTLARKPSAEELAICQRYLKRIPDRNEALEDVFWSLINSTEFLTKR